MVLVAFFYLILLVFIYPPKVAAKAEPGWDPIDFSYILIIPSCCLGRYFDVSKIHYIGFFEILKSLYFDGWVDGWMDGWVVTFTPFDFLYFQV